MAIAAPHPDLGTPSRLRRWLARAGAQVLTAYVVPDLRTARTFGLDPVAAGLSVVATPRHAAVLVMVGEAPPGLADAAATAYAQMPSPRAILRVGQTPLPDPLPAPNVTSALSQDDLAAGVARLRERLERLERLSPGGSSASDAAARGARADEVPASGAGADAHDSTGATPAADRGGTDQQAPPAATEPDHTGHAVGNEQHGDDGTPDHGHDDMDHGHHGHHGDHGDHGGMDHGDDMMGGGGFMSMVAMTKDLPRSPDGLPMERVDASFGPLFPGLPGGLALTFSLDGDAVADASIRPGVMARDLAEVWDGPAAGFAARFARLEPLTPATYELLAIRALERATGASSSVAGSWLTTVERERIISHLGWLSALGELLGDAWLAGQAAILQAAMVHVEDHSEVVDQRPAIQRFLAALGRRPLLRRRLAGGVTLAEDQAATTCGPVARGAGIDADARRDDPAYRTLGFAPVVRAGGDALARFRVRCAEITQSLDLIAAAGADAAQGPAIAPAASGHGRAAVETPRGKATLVITLDAGQVQVTRLDDPSTPHAALIPDLTRNLEIADALVAVASLDLSPWEMDR